MNYLFNDYFEQNNYNESVVSSEFIYDEKRICSKLYVFFKSLLLIFYTLSICSKSELFIIMLVVMYLSTINSACYEYQHFKIYGKIFSSINEFKEWKKKLYPKSKIIFSLIELIIKIIFFAQIFPPQFEFKNLCEIAESIFKIHILVILMIYIIIGLFCMCFFISYNFYSNSYQNYNRQSEVVSFPLPILLDNTQNEECCICLDKDNNISWSILPCGHKFHNSCISTWLGTHQTCPVCRLHMIRIS